MPEWHHRCGKSDEVPIFFPLDRFDRNHYPSPHDKFPNNYGKDFLMSFNFFDWVRDGVKNSVLGGVNDAVNVLGMPPDETAKEKVLGFLKTDSDSQVRRISSGTAPAGTKKLGRGLSEIAAKEAS
jgi:hypothetical protein